MSNILLFDRRATLTIQPAEFTGNGRTRKLARPWSEVDPIDGLDQISGLRTSFRIDKTIEKEPNRAEVMVYNLNANNRDAATRDDLLTLRAGYVGQDPLPIVFRGSITHFKVKKTPVDWVSHFSCGDGDALKKGLFNDLLPNGTELSSMIDRLKEKITDVGVDLMSSFDESVLHWIIDQFNRATSDPTNPGTQSGGESVTQGAKALQGRVEKVLTDEFDKVGLSWSVQNNVFIVRPKGGSDGRTAVFLSPSTGLIGSPEPTEKGIAGRCLIIPEVEPGRLIQIESAAIQGEFVLTRTNISGDTHSNNWYIDFEAMVEGTRIELPATGTGG